MVKPRNKEGQALMVVLLALAAVASVALTVSTRTTTDIEVTLNVEDSQRAFSAAEAGIEKTLLNPSQQPAGDIVVPGSGAKFSVGTVSIPTSPQEYSYPFSLSAGEIATVWFMSTDEDGNLSCSGLPCYTGNSIRLCWGEGNPAVSALQAGALEVTVYHESAGAIKASRTTIDPSDGRRTQNMFSFGADGTGCGVSGPIDSQVYAYTKLVNFSDLGITDYTTPGALKMMRVRFLYNTTAQPIGFRTNEAGVNLPSQGVKIDSLGSYGTAFRRLEAYSLYPAVPSMFEAALYSPSGIVK